LGKKGRRSATDDPPGQLVIYKGQRARAGNLRGVNMESVRLTMQREENQEKERKKESTLKGEEGGRR